MSNVAVQNLDAAIKNNAFVPKGVKVGFDLWNHLNTENRIKWVKGYVEGVADWGFVFPALDEKIFVHVDPNLDALGYELPQHA